ncbi:MAG: HNH endonuclease [Syntrophaceae bacterium]|nr:HNH endonuclease [Syntrophaceae bacterium]
MKDEIISYRQMCDAEKVQTLQRGMNYRLNANYSVILMSQRRNAPYKDSILQDGITIEYEGHDVPKTSSNLDPKKLDQPKVTMSGKLTQNGLFASAVEDYKGGKRTPEIVRAYEKIFSGVWSEKGFFKLIDYKYINADKRKVYRFFLEETEIDFSSSGITENKLRQRTRIIPSDIKKIVWERDNGRCVICGASDELHFDHDLPYSKGGASITPDNVRILCARHNLQKSDKIE